MKYTDQLEQLQKENDFLRALTANSDLNCIYCGLGADNQAQCVSGFPGCARADDQMLCRNFGDAAALHDATKRIAELEKFNVDLAQESHELQTILRRANERIKTCCVGLSAAVGDEVTDPIIDEIDAYLKKFG